MGGIPPEILTPGGIILAGVALIYLGRLVPYRFYKDIKDERDTYRLAFETERDARKASDEQTSKLLEDTKTNKHLLEAIFEIAKEMRENRKADV